MIGLPSPSGLIIQLFESINSSEPRPGLHPIPGTKALTVEAALLPPLVYYLALLFLPPPPPPTVDVTIIVLLRNTLAAIAGILFFRLPLAYHVPQSIGLTYQLGLVGIYGGCRVLDAFFISPYLFDHVPRRVNYTHVARLDTPHTEGAPKRTKEWSDGGLKDHFLAKRNLEGVVKTPDGIGSRTPISEKNTADASGSSSDSYFPSFMSALEGPHPQPVYEIARTEAHHPTTFSERASWAFELELSMRGTGFTWMSADVKHTRKTWLPSVGNRIHSILVHVLPVMIGSWAVISAVCNRYLAAYPSLYQEKNGQEIFDEALPLGVQLALTLALGAFLMAAFSFGHSMFAIMCAPLAPSPLAFFPPLYTTRVWDLTSVRKFWSFGWHRLFSRLFLVYGVWPGEWLERKLTGKKADQPADVGKVLGGFLSSAFVHSFSVRGVLGGNWLSASGEAKFFALNGLAVVFEEGFKRVVKGVRRRQGWNEKPWFDAWIGRVWWLAVLTFTGRNFARGWVKSSLVREMAFM